MQCANKTVQRLMLLSWQACFAAHAQKDASSTELNEQQSLAANFDLEQVIKRDLRLTDSPCISMYHFQTPSKSSFRSLDFRVAARKTPRCFHWILHESSWYFHLLIKTPLIRRIPSELPQKQLSQKSLYWIWHVLNTAAMLESDLLPQLE